MVTGCTVDGYDLGGHLEGLGGSLKYELLSSSGVGVSVGVGEDEVDGDVLWEDAFFISSLLASLRETPSVI